MELLFKGVPLKRMFKIMKKQVLINLLKPSVNLVKPFKSGPGAAPAHPGDAPEGPGPVLKLLDLLRPWHWQYK